MIASTVRRSSRDEFLLLATGFAVVQNLAGIALVVGSTACFAALDTTSKYVTTVVPLLMALVARASLVATAALTVLLIASILPCTVWLRAEVAAMTFCSSVSRLMLGLR